MSSLTEKYVLPKEARGNQKPSGGPKYSPAQKQEFFDLLADTGSVGLAAAKLVLNRGTCDQWAYQARKAAGTSVRQVKTSPEQQQEFFDLLATVGSVTEAAKVLGLNRNTCYQWVRRAGLARKRSEQPSREDFLRLRSEGLTRYEATVRLGIHSTTAQEWDAGIHRTKNGRVYPNGRAVDYNKEMTSRTNASGRPRATLQQLDRVIDSRYLCLADREVIYDMLSTGASHRTIATALQKSPSSISREIKRNSSPISGYRPYDAHRKSVVRRPRPKPSKISQSPRLKSFIKEGLRQRWSPEQISHKLVLTFPDDQDMRVCHETIYQALYFQPRGELRREVSAALRSGRTRRITRKNPEQRTSRFRDPMINISERPAEVEDRAVPGHWEGDLITGAHNQSAIATLVERSTRYVMLVHLPGDHGAESVRDGLIQTMSTLPAHLRGSLTWDQGVEMAKHKAFSIATGMDVYFCDPHSPWQRGSNENTNGLLRQYFPKGTDLSVYSPEDLEHVAQELNARPRKTLDWNTPAERLRDVLLTA
ncbi:transposase [Arthrobacter sp. PAMC 25486]|nr:transposase [Arthrobacter sp. PAMC 25486]AIY03463.1 transposase [Arthrobacter sp. PAMC 25486]